MVVGLGKVAPGVEVGLDSLGLASGLEPNFLGEDGGHIEWEHLPASAKSNSHQAQGEDEDDHWDPGEGIYINPEERSRPMLARAWAFVRSGPRGSGVKLTYSDQGQWRCG